MRSAKKYVDVIMETKPIGILLPTRIIMDYRGEEIVGSIVSFPLFQKLHSKILVYLSCYSIFSVVDKGLGFHL